MTTYTVVSLEKKTIIQFLLGAAVGSSGRYTSTKTLTNEVPTQVELQLNRASSVFRAKLM